MYNNDKKSGLPKNYNKKLTKKLKTTPKIRYDIHKKSYKFLKLNSNIKVQKRQTTI